MVVDIIECLECPFDVHNVGVVARRVLQQVLEEDDVFRESLNRFNKKAVDAQPPKLVLVALDLKILVQVGALLSEAHDGPLPLLVVVAVLEVDLEEGGEFDDDVKHELVREVVVEAVRQFAVQLLIELLDFLYVGKDDCEFLAADQLERPHGVLEVADDQTQVVDVHRFSIDELLDDVLAVGEELADAADSLAGEPPAVE